MGTRKKEAEVDHVLYSHVKYQNQPTLKSADRATKKHLTLLSNGFNRLIYSH
jgi:hypothetical protein